MALSTRIPVGLVVWEGGHDPDVDLGEGHLLVRAVKIQRSQRCACATRTACITSSACVIPQNARLFSIQSSQKLWSDGSNDTIMMMLIVDCYHFVFALDSKLFHQIPNSDLWWSLSTITTALNIITIIINSSISIRFCNCIGLQTVFPTSFQIWKLTFEKIG